MKSRFISLCLALGIAATAWAQKQTVKGSVVDADGEPVIGAVVKTQDGKTAGVTDVNGAFTLSVPEGKTTLVISSVGLKTQMVNVTPGKPLNVKMASDEKMLDELVVVGYGIQKKSALTGSIETIKAEDLVMQPVMNLDQALTGQVAGLQVMQATGDPSTAREANIRVRGINDAPLLVIDGVPRFGTTTSDGEMRLSDLNPDDIESVTILKDAAAAAVYGSRAANGVVLVQTKRAKGDQKVHVNYRGQYNVEQSTRNPEFLDAYQFALLRNRAVDNTPGTTIAKYTDAQLEQIKNHTAPNVYGDEDYMAYLDKTGFSTTHSVSMTGGNQLVRYYLSLGYADAKGIYTGIGRNRLTYSAKLDATLAKGLVLSFSEEGTRTRSKNSSYSTLSAAYSYSPLQVYRFSNGELASINGGNPLINIYGLGGYIKSISKMNTVTVNLRWEVPWVKGLSAYLRGTFDDNHRIESTFSRPVTLYTYDVAADTYAADPNTVYPTAKVSLRQADNFYDSQLYEMGANFNRTFARKHDVEGTLVANYQRTHAVYARY